MAVVDILTCMKSLTTILAIESSCDETAAAVLIGDLKSKTPSFKIVSSVVKSQINIHKKWGGVVPEAAARAHIQNVLPVTQKAISDAKINLNKLDLVAVTAGPGLIPSLLVGVEFAKGLATGANIPLLPVNHMEGHLYSPFESGNKLNFPMLSVIVSGGHTMLVLQKDEKHYKVLGSTVDDAAGEAFDKVAKLLKLPYPGGPEISKLAETGSNVIPFPRPMINSKDYNFSFAGLKTAVRYFLEDQKKVTPVLKANISRSFEEAVCEVLVTKTMRAVKQYKCKTVSLSGGVAANKRLRQNLADACKQINVKCIIPEFELCTDNAGMIAIASYFRLRAGVKPQTPNKVKANSSWEIK
jgi:N6-L-threonylcarbamoyladenine synthase